MPDRPFAKRVERLTFSSSQAAIRRVRELRQSGVQVHDFGSKFDTPDHVKAAALGYLNSSEASLYADPRGISELRTAIARKLIRENQLAVDADTEITVTPGGKAGIVATLLALVGPGDDVLLEDPGWLSFDPMIRVTGARPVPLALRESNGFRLDAADLQKRITKRTKVLVLCSPHNPTGAILSRSDLEAIAAVCIEHDLFVIMDEAYEHFVFDGHRHISMATIAGMRERTIVVQTASKTFNMFGWRVGWVVAPPAISEKIRLVSVHSFTCVTSFAQAGAAAALDGHYAQGTLTIPEMMQNYQLQRDALVAGLRAIKGVTCAMPAGAYFAFPRISRFGMTSQDFAAKLLANARVSGLAGSVFGKRGEGHIRFVFNAPVPAIEEGVARLRDYLGTL
jgi:aspartate/methionine/tyrosine aminotransferase